MSHNLKQLDQTCGACPSQWEGTLEDGRAVYVRYRHGWLTATAAPTMDRAVMAYDGDRGLEVLADQAHGGVADGFMTEAEMLELTGLTL